jgi:membrane fusion protein, epimerase transport system
MAYHGQEAHRPATLDHSASGSIAAGALIMIAFFAGLGGWAAMAPLSSAVMAPAVIKVEGNRKAVQHPDGGVVRELFVKEGDRVSSGQVLLVLDNTQARGTTELLTRQYTELRAQEARLLSEQAEARSIAFPRALLARRADPEVARIMRVQTTYFETARKVRSGQVEIMRQKIAQTRELITGAEAQLHARRAQLASVQSELSGLRDLFKQGYVPRQRMLELERAAAALEGQVAEIEANIVRMKQSIEELNLQIVNLRAEHMSRVAAELRDVQLRLIEIEPRLGVSRELVKRMNVTAPESGAVVGLTAFTVGGVVGAGERIMEIVPEAGELIVEATISVEDQKDVRTGMQAEVHLTAYRQRSPPIVRGGIVHVSADRFTDPRTGLGYFLAQVRIDEQEVSRMQDIRLSPGMPAMVVIPTGERTALDYLLRPLTDSFHRAWREQ